MGDWVGAAVTPHLGPGEGPEESVGTPVGPGGPHHHRAATVVLETIRVALRSQPYTLLRLQGPDIGEELEKSSVSSPQPPHLSSPLAVSSLITFPPHPWLHVRHKHPSSLTPETHPGTSTGGEFLKQPPQPSAKKVLQAGVQE
jgi:hypothetical protein